VLPFFGERRGKVSRAKFVTKSVGVAHASGGNVVLLPFVERHDVQPVQTSFLAGEGVDPMPPWLIEEEGSAQPKLLPKKIAKARKPAPKKVAAKKKKVKAKATPKAAAKPRSQKKPTVPTTPITERHVIATAEAPAIAAPLSRSQAPVVWQKNGPLSILRYWLRSTSRRMLTAIMPVPKASARHADPKLRTRKALLLELATLREENAMMRKKLGLPDMPFGRQVADRI
jgi:hypothetical protein